MQCSNVQCTKSAVETYRHCGGKVQFFCDDHIPEPFTRDCVTGDLYNPCEFCPKREMIDPGCEFCTYYT